ncbi:5-amino-6-(D-ribitylamino)uracil--L-tyrosine 4-hydroxyphenyl transferase CofH [Rubrobacter radiotolerans]|uniref:FO synthase n=1 Tax=Rubrobacter radiotolerans TaxID=42256 RepID=A0AB35T3K8_RUBRA|nr:5-amino-6-(D-ribitylamino)uracil--L-tyrosine 4-hydroxyphenyl transferase CofH [Rubrobacter radiotolerans]MDX5893577.1 5-amino-6-(D-ribitylamino)uracil--L-tyrosine 4-hydroxyphenyl transferase CofH [Rubrobacter radiotolerans]
MFFGMVGEGFACGIGEYTGGMDTSQKSLYATLISRAEGLAGGLGREDAYRLARLATEDPAPAMAAASSVRDGAFGPRVTYSRKVFIPLTKLCRDNCGYCTFAHPPRPGERAYLTPEEVLEIARSGAEAGCKEALFTLGDKPEKRYREAREELCELGFATTVEYLAHCSRLVFEETGLLPHANPGVLSAEDIRRLREVTVSQGIMMEEVSGRLLGRDLAHWASPDKKPERRLATLEEAGRQGVPFTTGLLIGIGETTEERVDTLLAIRDAHARHGHVQECIVQNFRAKPGTRMADAPEPGEREMLATISLARLLLPPEVTVQAPPNLAGDETDGSYAAYIDAGINDWGGVSPVTPDHVNPERPWPHLDALKARTEEKGYLLMQRLALHPAYALECERWVDARLRPKVKADVDSEGFAREHDWSPGMTSPVPAEEVAEARGGRPSRMRPEFVRALTKAGERDLDLREIETLFTARGTEFSELCRVADELRRAVIGDEVTYVVNRNINYTNLCYFRCKFCAFSKGPKSLNLRGEPYLLSTEEVARRAREAWDRGASEVTMVGGIHASFTGRNYLEYLRAVKEEVPGMHVHAFTPLEVWQGAKTLGVSVREFLIELKDAGLSTLPGTAAEVLDDEVRAVICPDKVNTRQWVEVMREAHALGLQSTTTIMFGHVDRPVNWARHLLVLRDLQAETGGFTEFIPLPFVHMGAPLFLQGNSRRGPTFSETVKMHAVGRLALYGYIDNVQVSWVKLGVEGAKVALQSGCNDLGGTLMNESISRAAGADHGQEMLPEELEAVIRDLGRTPRLRNTLYGTPEPRERATEHPKRRSALPTVRTR